MGGGFTMRKGKLSETLANALPANRGIYQPRGCTPTRTFETRPRRFGHVQRRDSDVVEAGDKDETRDVVREGTKLQARVEEGDSLWQQPGGGDQHDASHLMGVCCP